jgi:hypothetical protein
LFAGFVERHAIWNRQPLLSFLQTVDENIGGNVLSECDFSSPYTDLHWTFEWRNPHNAYASAWRQAHVQESLQDFVLPSYERNPALITFFKTAY